MPSFCPSTPLWAVSEHLPGNCQANVLGRPNVAGSCGFLNSWQDKKEKKIETPHQNSLREKTVRGTYTQPFPALPQDRSTFPVAWACGRAPHFCVDHPSGQASYFIVACMARPNRPTTTVITPETRYLSRDVCTWVWGGRGGKVEKTILRWKTASTSPSHVVLVPSGHFRT